MLSLSFDIFRISWSKPVSFYARRRLIIRPLTGKETNPVPGALRNVSRKVDFKVIKNGANFVKRKTRQIGGITEADIARRLRVSQSTVSIVLSGKWEKRISTQMAQKILRLADELDFRPNATARSLRIGATNAVLFLSPVISNPFFARVHTAIARAAAGHGISVIVYPVDSADDDGAPLFHAYHGVDGVIACSLDAPRAESFAGGRPLVLVDSNPATSHITVNANIAEGVEAAICHLAKNGARHIHHLAAAKTTWTFRERQDAVARACKRLGLTLTKVLTPPTMEKALAHAQHLITTGSPPFSFFCDNDPIAIGVYLAAQFDGLKIPQDISVIGMDDGEIGRLMKPPLTSIEINTDILGELAMKTMVDLLEKKPVTSHQIIAPLKVRGSVAGA
ncbi:LacI family DNA-binding transcriptional regulator [Rhizobium sp. NPDC090279]|uniref:LacI family DNA-binding transcriptional regulator n=1 Tax=Rhizobium sp. NPDC090279 TaxID=3364499 RepID=UPI00383B2666